jgi:LPXTG-motif cell wall-anchored protein
MKLRTALRPLAALVVAMLVATYPAAAFAATASVVYIGPGAGWANIYNGNTDAGSYEFTVDGTEVEAFCVEMNETFDPNADYTTGNPDTTSIPNLDKAAWLAAEHRNVATPAADPADEASATQLAIWNYTDGITIDATTVPDAAVRDRALALVAAAASQSLALPASDTTVALTGVADGAEAVWTVTATADGEPVDGAAVTLNAGSESVPVTTGADGSATVRTARAATGPTDATVSWDVETGPGAILVPNSDGQLLVTGTPTTAQRTASASVAAQEVPTTTAPPVTATPESPAAPPSTVPASSSETLPRTGGSLGVDQLIIAAVLLTIGGYAVVRRRRSL